MTCQTAKRLSNISMQHVIPDVFSPEDVGESQIWLKEFTFVRGRHYLVEAASGSGKSSMCSFIYRNRSDYRGSIGFDGRDAKSLTADEISDLRCHNIALLPQELRLFGQLTAIDNVRIKNRLTGYCSEKQIIEMFGRLGIADKINRPASLLSIGQMQRVALIRALCQPFDFIFLDEPVSHLDENNNRIVASLIYETAEAQNASIIATSVGNQLLLPTDNINHIRL